MRFPFDELELENRLLALENTLLRFGGSRRRIPSQEEQAVQEFGQSLLQALLVGEVRTRYEVSLLEARRQNKGLRLKLRIQPPELARLPWEFLYDPDHDEYLSLSDKTPLVRYVDLHRPIEQLPVTPPLRILGMVASPQDLPELDVEHEKRLVEQALRTLRASRLVELSWLEGQTWEDLQQAMWGGPWHIFHFIGHGVFNQASDEGCIALSDEEGRSRLLGARNLARLLDGHYPLRLVLLNSCEGARGSARDAFSGAAATLVRRGIPAVVAMQYEITDEAAIAFARTFYRAVANDLPVDAAVAAGRTAISMDNALEWGTPVLYMRSPDGRIFDVSTEVPSAGPGREQPEDREEEERRNRLNELYAQARSLHRDREWQRVVDVFDQINALDPAYPDPEGLLALARAELAAVEQERAVAALYNQGIRHMQTEEWSKAREYFEEIQRLEPGYQDTERLLSQARQEEERKNRLDELEAEAHRLHQDREWQGVVDVFDQIKALDPTYPDPEGLLTSARGALDQERRMATLYDQGVRHLNAEEWSEALEYFEEVQRLEPGHRETERLLSQVRQVLAKPPSVEVPDLTGKTASQANKTLEHRGLNLGDQNETPSDAIPAGKISGQDPAARTKVEQDRSVSITVSSGPRKARVPNISDKSIRHARRILSNAGLIMGSSQTQESDKRAGTIISTDPAAGSEVDVGTSVTPIVSGGVNGGNQGPKTPYWIVVAMILFGALALGGGVASFAFLSSDMPFKDDFSSTSSGWLREEYESGAVSDYANGGYRLYLPKRSTHLLALAPPPVEPEDTIVEVDATITGASTAETSYWGVVCRGDLEGNYYGMGINNDGRAYITKITNGNFAELTSGSNDAISNGSEPNHIRGECVGSNLTLFVNDQKILEADDADYDSGSVGLFVAKGGTGRYSDTDVSFDNFAVSKP